MLRRKKIIPQFWITNISNRIISLPDLNLHIQPKVSINILDPRHYSITQDAAIKSATSGSIFSRRGSVIVRQFAPGIKKKDIIPFQENAIFPDRKRSAIEVEKIQYEELSVSDDKYAEENAEMAEEDHLGKYKE